MAVAVPTYEFSPHEQRLIDDVYADIAVDFPDVPIGTHDEAIAGRMQLTQAVFQAAGGLLLGSEFKLGSHIDDLSVPAVIINPGLGDAHRSQNEHLIRGRIIMAGLSPQLGPIQPSPYEDGGDHFGLVIPTAEAVHEISSHGSEVPLRPHQEVTQVVTDGRMSAVGLYKALMLYCVRDGLQPTPSRIVSVQSITGALTDQERAILSEPQFTFGPFDLIKSQLTNHDPYVYAPYNPETGETVLDLDDTKGLNPDAQAVIDRLFTLSQQPEHSVIAAIEPGKLLVVNNRAALHGRGSMAKESIIPGKERLLQRTQIGFPS